MCNLYACKYSILFSLEVKFVVHVVCLQNVFRQAVLGCVVLTDYNNHTYRIDDVNFDVTPSSTFKLRSGEDISYVEYYLRVSIFWVSLIHIFYP
jgi:hypothetical protein